MVGLRKPRLIEAARETRSEACHEAPNSGTAMSPKTVSAHPFFLSPYFQQEILQTGFSAYPTDPTPTIFLEHLNT